MNRVYCIADLHFGHEKIARIMGFGSIEDHDNALIENWNRKVNKNDTVWILGDVAMGHDGYIDILGHLKGYKKLILGNHDTSPTELYLRHVERVYGAVRLKECILTHIPVHPTEFPRFKGNIHGHLHDKKIKDDRYFCVSAEQTEYAPMLLSDIIAKFETKNLCDQKVNGSCPHNNLICNWPYCEEGVS